jgi:uncharacterized protein
MFERAITQVLRKTVSTFPVTVLTGPRQSGKTTLLKELFPDYAYVNLEAPDTLLRAQADPRGFLELNERVIIDEAQHFPALFSYLQEYIDMQKIPGKFVLSGSQNFLLAEKISQSLAGRAAILELLPLTFAEFMSNPEMKQPDIWHYLFHGSYPRPYHEHLDTELWYQSYIRTYLERDVRSLMNVRELSKFQLFLKLCAGRHGQLLNMTALAQETGISQTQAAHWISILEASYLVYRLQPYYRNFNKRLVKTPKLFFYDSAIVCMLLGIESPKHLALHASRGAIFEGFVLTEIIKTIKGKGKATPIYFWRDHQGHELDGLIEKGNQLVTFDAKSGKTITSDMFDSLVKWQAVAGEAAVRSAIIYGGSQSMQQRGFEVLSWKSFADNLLA